MRTTRQRWLHAPKSRCVDYLMGLWERFFHHDAFLNLYDRSRAADLWAGGTPGGPERVHDAFWRKKPAGSTHTSRKTAPQKRSIYLLSAIRASVLRLSVQKRSLCVLCRQEQPGGPPRRGRRVGSGEQAAVTRHSAGGNPHSPQG